MVLALLFAVAPALADEVLFRDPYDAHQVWKDEKGDWGAIWEEAGQLHFRCDLDSNRWTRTSVTAGSMTDNWRLSVELTVLSGGGPTGTGLLFGSNAAGSAHWLGLRDDLWILATYNGAWETIVPEGHHDAIKPKLGDKNLLIIESSEGRWKIWVNGVAVGDVPARPVYDHQVGIYTGSFRHAVFDNLTLERVTTPTPASQSPTVAGVSTSPKLVLQKKVPVGFGAAPASPKPVPKQPPIKSR